MPIATWVKKHITTLLLGAVILILLWILFDQQVGLQPFSSDSLPTTSDQTTTVGSRENLTPQRSSFETGNKTNNTERITVKNSNISLLVTDVKKTGENILSYTKDKGGYMVEVSYNRPSESPFGTITVRVPTEKLDETLKYFRGLGIKVTNEHL